MKYSCNLFKIYLYKRLWSDKDNFLPPSPPPPPSLLIKHQNIRFSPKTQPVFLPQCFVLSTLLFAWECWTLAERDEALTLVPPLPPPHSGIPCSIMIPKKWPQKWIDQHNLFYLAVKHLPKLSTPVLLTVHTFKLCRSEILEIGH